MKKAKILLIEDDVDVLSINREYFESNGYDTVSATTLSHARFQLEEHAPDLILLDVMLPDGTGWDFCTFLRQKTKAPIIFLTCRNENESIVKGLLQGADDYVTKPYDLNVLGARVAAQLRRAGIMSAGKIELPPLVIDLVSGEVILSDERIYLTKKETQLLACFSLFPGQRLTRSEIYRRAWGESAHNTSHALAVHITNLRKKLKLDEEAWFELKSTAPEEYMFSKVRY